MDNVGRRMAIIAGALTMAGTLALPARTQDGDVWEGMTTQALSSLTVNAPGGATVGGGAFLAPADTGFSYRYVASLTKWLRRW